jgi:hypothetical protein
LALHPAAVQARVHQAWDGAVERCKKKDRLCIDIQPCPYRHGPRTRTRLSSCPYTLNIMFYTAHPMQNLRESCNLCMRENAIQQVRVNISQ